MGDTSLAQSLFAGGCAGLSVDLILYPFDTVKTRLQSEKGFLRSGGFRGIYQGIGSVSVASVPGASLFFCTYDSLKHASGNPNSPMVHMAAASCGEVAACSVRVPCEVVKQRAQTQTNMSSFKVLTHTIQQEGLTGLYRGYKITIIREIPFAFIQFPLWEYLKKKWCLHQGHEVNGLQSAIAGAFAGGTAALCTTPLDVAKTRIILAKKGSALARGGMIYALKIVGQQTGLKGLFSGAVPRTLMIAFGGSIFLGAYDQAVIIWNR